MRPPRGGTTRRLAWVWPGETWRVSWGTYGWPSARHWMALSRHKAMPLIAARVSEATGSTTHAYDLAASTRRALTSGADPGLRATRASAERSPLPQAPERVVAMRDGECSRA